MPAGELDKDQDNERHALRRVGGDDRELLTPAFTMVAHTVHIDRVLRVGPQYAARLAAADHNEVVLDEVEKVLPRSLTPMASRCERIVHSTPNSVSGRQWMQARIPSARAAMACSRVMARWRFPAA